MISAVLTLRDIGLVALSMLAFVAVVVLACASGGALALDARAQACAEIAAGSSHSWPFPALTDCPAE